MVQCGLGLERTCGVHVVVLIFRDAHSPSPRSQSALLWTTSRVSSREGAKHTRRAWKTCVESVQNETIPATRRTRFCREEQRWAEGFGGAHCVFFSGPADLKAVSYTRSIPGMISKNTHYLLSQRMLPCHPPASDGVEEKYVAVRSMFYFRVR